MKKILFPLAISFLMLLLFGCQDNSGTNPVSSPMLNKTDTNNGKIIRGTIPLDTKLIDPINKDIEYTLIGDINYSEEPVMPNPTGTFLGQDDKLDESVSAKLTTVSSIDSKVKTYKISSMSDNVVKFPMDNVDVLVKYYPVIGMPDRTDLVCTFDVSRNGEELTKVMLENPVVGNNN